MKMKPEVKKLWIEALRSGEYQQGQHQLRNGNKYCCLGVLCDLYSKETDNGHWSGTTTTFYDGVGDSDKTTLPVGVRIWSGVTRGGDYEANALCDDNDMGKSFTEIADIIEKHF